MDPIIKHISLWMLLWEGITIESPHVPSIFGLKGLRDGTCYHISHEESSHIHSTLTSQHLISGNPMDISA